MRRIETLAALALADLRANTYRNFHRNEVSDLSIARALDALREAEKTLRRAYGER